MTTTVPRPETLVPRLTEQPFLDADAVSLRRLRAAVAGADREWPQSLAMAWLCETDFPNKHRDYERVLKDAEARVEARCLAAHYLGRISHPAAQDILIGGLDIANDRIRSAVLEALARVGGPAAFDAIMRSVVADIAALAERARFALALIACRNNEERFDLAALGEEDCAPCPAGDAPGFGIETADAAEVELCLRCLGPRPFSIELAERPAYQICCGDERWILLFNRAVSKAASAGELRGRKHFVGIVASRASASGGYGAALLILAGPGAREGTGNLLVYRASGRLAMAGRLAIAGGAVEFRLRSTSGPRPVTVDIEGAFAAGGLEIARAIAGPGDKLEAIRTFSPGSRLGHAG